MREDAARASYELESIADIRYGFTAKACAEPLGPKFLRITDIQDGSVDWTTVPFCETTENELQKFKLSPGEIVFARTGATTGKSYLIRDEVNAVFASYLIRVKPTSHRVDPRYLAYYFQTAEYWAEVEAGTEGAAQGGFNASKLGKLRIPLPSLNEQKRIVAVLDQAFAALDRARAHAEANLADAEELFDRSLLAAFDSLLPSSIKMTLSDAASYFSRGKSRHRPRNDPSLYDGEYPFIQTGDIRRSEGSIREYSQTYNEAGLAQSKLWPIGTVCITIAANIAETGVLEFEGCFPDSVIGMIPKPDVAMPYYVEYMLRYFAKELKLQGKGSAQDNINVATFESAKFPFPSIDRQIALVEKLDGIAAHVGTLRQSYSQTLADIADLRQSLLQKAFSGQLT